MDIKPIKTAADYDEAALKEIDSLMTAELDTPEGDRLNWCNNGAHIVHFGA
jgi:HTH-type transcriptional regulator/antitoxin HigA